MPPHNAIIINLTRFGDLLQSQPIFNALAARDFHNTLVCLENFAFAAGLLRNVHRTCPFPGSGLLKNLDVSWFAAIGKLRDWISELLTAYPEIAHPEIALPENPALQAHPENRAHPALPENRPASFPLLLINLTPTLPGRILSGLIEDRLKARGIEVESRGFGIDQFGFGLNRNPWAAYLLASCQERGQSHFNLVDVFYRAAGFAGYADSRLAEPTPEHVEQSLAILRAEFQAARSGAAGPGYPGYPGEPGEPGEPEKDADSEELARSGAISGFVAFQLGASSEMRRWPVEYFCEVGKMLWERARFCPVLLGAEGELPLAAEYRNHCGGRHPFINMCGRTTPLELAATLKNCRLLITNDTGTMHLAAGLGLDVMAIFLVTAQACDTGPYIEGACLLEPALSCHPCAFGSQCPHEYRCRLSISPRLVGALALDKLERSPAPGQNGEETAPSAGRSRAPFRMPREFLKRNFTAYGDREKRDEREAAEETGATGARVWISGRDRHGFMGLQSISGHRDEERSVLFKLLRHFQRQLLDCRPGQGGQGGQGGQSEQCRRPFTLRPGQSLNPQVLKECRELEALLHLVREQGGMLLSHPLPALKTRFLAGWQRAREAMSKSRHFSSIGRLWIEESQNLGEDLRRIIVLAEGYQAMFAAIRQSLESQNSRAENI